VELHFRWNKFVSCIKLFVSIGYICKVDVKIKLSKCNDIAMTTTTPTLGKEQVFLFGGRGGGNGGLDNFLKGGRKYLSHEA
jgi:hypothetical protein